MFSYLSHRSPLSSCRSSIRKGVTWNQSWFSCRKPPGNPLHYNSHHRDKYKGCHYWDDDYHQYPNKDDDYHQYSNEDDDYRQYPNEEDDAYHQYPNEDDDHRSKAWLLLACKQFTFNSVSWSLRAIRTANLKILMKKMTKLMRMAIKNMTGYLQPGQRFSLLFSQPSTGFRHSKQTGLQC